ncbi:FAD synthetase family protein [Peribacillus frigoritolerans]|uniref:FAD synthetase family protein n=1 Tax=Peribacillus castrilensis TaxID=2897690 RepID=UPI00296E47DF|nr:FAD synthetase family protein [Peribacillus castrilensis]
MEIHTQDTLQLSASVLSIGALDGIHRGHQALLLKAKERAEKLGVPFVVYTFDPPPKVFFKGCPLLMSVEEKLQRLEMLGADHVIVGSFDEAFTKKEVPVFIEELKEMNPIEIWEGPNFLFGKNREGTIEVLRRYFKVEVLQPLTCEQGEMISSSRIRKLLQQGNYPQVKKLLGVDCLTMPMLENLYVRKI